MAEGALCAGQWRGPFRGRFPNAEAMEYCQEILSLLERRGRFAAAADDVADL